MRGKQTSRARLIPGQGPLASVPPVAAFALVVALFAAGVLVGGALGAALLGLLVLFVAALLAATWSVLTGSQRAGRVLVLAVLVAVAVSLLLR